MDDYPSVGDVDFRPGSISEPCYYPFWAEVLKADNFVLDIIKNGYSLPLERWPEESWLPNNKSSLKEREFVAEQLEQMLKLGVIEEVSKRPRVVMPLSVVTTAKKRLVADASRQLNIITRKRRIKLEGLSQANEAAREGDWCMTYDLRHGFYQVMMHPKHRCLLGIAWEDKEGTTRFYRYKVMVFGLRDAVYLFTKLMRPLLKYCRSLGIRMSVYVDDYRVLGHTRRQCQAHGDMFVSVLRRCGWQLSMEKCSTEPVQRTKYLGFINDLTNLTYSIPEAKLEKITELIKEALKNPSMELRQLAGIYGKLSSCSLATGPIIALLTRSGQAQIARESDVSWNREVSLDADVQKELEYLLGALPAFSTFPMHSQKSVVSTEAFATVSDASDVGFATLLLGDDAGAVQLQKDPDNAKSVLMRKVVFSPDDARKSSTQRELVAVHDLYASGRAAQFKNSRMVHYSDNQSTVRILHKGSTKKELQRLAVEIFKNCFALGIHLDAQWIPREDARIQAADYFSKDWDLSDWGVSPRDYAWLQSVFGTTFDLDPFASESNARCSSFCSKTFSYKALAPDAFAVNWSDFTSTYVCPPPHLIVDAIKHAVLTGASGLLVVPLWRGSYYWFSLCEDGRHLNRFFDSFVFWHPLLIAGPHLKNRIFEGEAAFPMLALSFKPCQKPWESLVSKSRCLSLDHCPLC